MEKRSLSSTDDVLMIFVKNPEPGKVKTRLAQKIGEKKAAEVYEESLKITKAATAPLTCTKKVYYQDYLSQDDLWEAEGYEKCLQAKGGLGEKMSSVFQENLEQFSKVVIIGSDCPGITTDHLLEAFSRLNNHDVVIGPAEDGGYYLLGLKQFEPELFSQKSWSTDQVLEETLETLETKGYSCHLLPVLNDIDTLEDLEKSPLAKLV